MHGSWTIAIQAKTIKALASPGGNRYSPSAPSDGCLTRCGRSSGVEHNLAKVGVVSSNLIARSIICTMHEGRRLGGLSLQATQPSATEPHLPIIAPRSSAEFTRQIWDTS